MINQHPAEEEIQLFVTGQLDNFRITAHIEICDKCREEVMLYRLLVEDIAKQTPARFDFDVEALVSSQLVPVQSKYKKDGPFIGIAISVSACLVMISLYSFRSNFVMLAGTTSVVFVYSSLISCIFILLLKGMRLYRKYQEQIKKLNFS